MIKVQIEWKPLTRARKIEGRITIAFFWLMVPFGLLNGARRFGWTWTAFEWAIICALIALMMTGLILRVERAQREQHEKP